MQTPMGRAFKARIRKVTLSMFKPIFPLRYVRTGNPGYNGHPAMQNVVVEAKPVHEFALVVIQATLVATVPLWQPVYATKRSVTLNIFV